MFVQLNSFIVQSGFLFLVLPSYPVLTIILGYNNLADQNYNLLCFWEVPFLGMPIMLLLNPNSFSLATNLLLPINLCTVDLSIIWVGQYLYGNAVF